LIIQTAFGRIRPTEKGGMYFGCSPMLNQKFLLQMRSELPSRLRFLWYVLKNIPQKKAIHLGQSFFNMSHMTNYNSQIM